MLLHHPDVASKHVERPSRKALAAICGLVSAALFLPSQTLLAQASPPAAAIKQCDALAAHADDPEAVSPGISDTQLNPPAAASACEAAVKASPDTPRLRFQLARAYLKSSRLNDALDQLLIAAEAGHGGALAYLADIHLDGTANIEADPALAQTLYQKALASGFLPAGKILQEFEDKTAEYAQSEQSEQAEGAALQPSAPLRGGKPYKVPALMDNIYSGNFDAIYYDEIWSKKFLVIVADNIQAVCEAHFSKNDIDILTANAETKHYGLASTGPLSMATAVLGRMVNINTGPITAARSMSAIDSIDSDPFPLAMNDTTALFSRHSCRTPGLAQFSRNLTLFVRNARAPLPEPDAIVNACLKDTPPSIYKPFDFCLCFTGGLQTGRVSQFHRKTLVSDFKNTAAAIANVDVNAQYFRTCRFGPGR